MSAECLAWLDSRARNPIMMLMQRLISWQFSPTVIARGDTDKESINTLRETLEPFKTGQLRQPMRIILSECYAYYRKNAPDGMRDKMPLECPYSPKNFLKTSYFPNIAATTPALLTKTTKAA